MKRYFEASFLFGLVGGLFCIVAFLVFKWMGLDPTNFSMIFGYVIVPVFLFLGIRYFKSRYNQGQLSFAHGMTIGFLIYTQIALLSMLGIWLILMLSPGLFEELKETKIAVMNSNKTMIIEQLDADSFNVTYESVLAMTPADIALNDFIWKILPGLFFTIIISIILRKTTK